MTAAFDGRTRTPCCGRTVRVPEFLYNSTLIYRTCPKCHEAWQVRIIPGEPVSTSAHSASRPETAEWRQRALAGPHCPVYTSVVF